jgi:hypothetical protein
VTEVTSIDELKVNLALVEIIEEMPKHFKEMGSQVVALKEENEVKRKVEESANIFCSFHNNDNTREICAFCREHGC